MKVDVPPNGFDRALKRFMRLVRSEQIMTDLKDQEFFTAPGEERRIKQRRAIKRRVRADAKARELDTLTTAPMSYVEKSQERLRRAKPVTDDRGKP